MPRVWLVGLVFNLIFWLAAVVLDFPRTYWDDSVIIGPAISLAETGLLRNPYLNRSFYPGDTYLFYPPGFFWVLGGWIALFGKSVLALALFWAACGLVASASLAVLLVRLSGSRIAWFVAPLLVFGCIAYTGHRYEILAFASFFAGLALAVSGRRLTGYLLLILTPTIAPTFLALCTITVLAIFARHWRGRFLGEAGLVAIGLAIACLTIVAGVGGDVAGLVETIYGYRSVRIGFGGRDIIAYRLVAAVIGLNIATALCWFALAGQGWRSIRFQLPLLVILAVLLTLASHARPSLVVAMNIASITLAALALADALAALLWPASPLRVKLQWLPTLGLMCVAAILLFLNLRYIATIAHAPLDPAQVREAQSALARVPADRLVVADARVMKEAFGFLTNRSIEDSLIRNAWPDYRADFGALPTRETWITSRGALAATIDPAAVPISGGVIDMLFIATGMGRVAEDGICVFDASASAKWPAFGQGDFVETVCRPDQAR